LLYIAPQHEALSSSGVNGPTLRRQPARASIFLLSYSRGALFDPARGSRTNALAARKILE